MKKVILTENEYLKVCEILGESMNKQQLIRKVYKVLDPYLSKMHRDDDWNTILVIKNKLQETFEDCKVDIWCDNGGYRSNRDNTAHWKEYNFNIYNGEKTILSGILNCHAAGTMDDMFSRYDITIHFN